MYLHIKYSKAFEATGEEAEKRAGLVFPIGDSCSF